MSVPRESHIETTLGVLDTADVQQTIPFFHRVAVLSNFIFPTFSVHQQWNGTWEGKT